MIFIYLKHDLFTLNIAIFDTYTNISKMLKFYYDK